MTTQPIPVIPPADPLTQHCRAVIEQAGHVTLTLLGDHMRDIRVIRQVNPALASALAPFLDAVMTLDATTGFLDDDPGI